MCEQREPKVRRGDLKTVPKETERVPEAEKGRQFTTLGCSDPRSTRGRSDSRTTPRTGAGQRFRGDTSTECSRPGE